MKRREVITRIQALLVAALPGARVVINDYSTAATEAMEKAFEETGWCICLPPLVGSDVTTSAGSRTTEKALYAVAVRVVPKHVAQLDVYAIHDQVKAAVLAGEQQQIKAAEVFCRHQPEDVGLFTHQFQFIVPIDD